MALVGSEDHLEWEQRQSKPAAIAAVLAGALIFIGTVWRQLALADLPRTGVLESLDRLSESGPIGRLESLKVETYQAYNEQAFSVIASSVCVALGYLALGWALTYLAVAVRARRPEFPKLLVYLPMIGGVLQAISNVLSSLATNLAVSDFLDSDRTVETGRDGLESGLGLFAQLVALPGGLAIALALVMIALNAMRVGLLTRFMGVLGIFTGALQVLPLSGPLPVVQSFWLLMLGVLFSGRWPGGRPPAWQTGEAMPWPSGAELREMRKRAAAEARGETYEPPAPAAVEAEPEPREPVAAGPSPSASARKRKRKKR